MKHVEVAERARQESAGLAGDARPSRQPAGIAKKLILPSLKLFSASRLQNGQGRNLLVLLASDARTAVAAAGDRYREEVDPAVANHAGFSAAWDSASATRGFGAAVAEQWIQREAGGN